MDVKSVASKSFFLLKANNTSLQLRSPIMVMWSVVLNGMFQHNLATNDV